MDVETLICGLTNKTAYSRYWRGVKFFLREDIRIGLASSRDLYLLMEVLGSIFNGSGENEVYMTGCQLRHDVGETHESRKFQTTRSHLLFPRMFRMIYYRMLQYIQPLP